MSHLNKARQSNLEDQLLNFVTTLKQNKDKPFFKTEQYNNTDNGNDNDKQIIRQDNKMGESHNKTRRYYTKTIARQDNRSLDKIIARQGNRKTIQLQDKSVTTRQDNHKIKPH
jgi:hypothetical protein